MSNYRVRRNLQSAFGGEETPLTTLFLSQNNSKCLHLQGSKTSGITARLKSKCVVFKHMPKTGCLIWKSSCKEAGGGRMEVDQLSKDPLRCCSKADNTSQRIWTTTHCVNIDLYNRLRLVACDCLALDSVTASFVSQIRPKRHGICWLLHWIHNIQYTS